MENLIQLVANLQEEETLKIVKEEMERGTDPLKILEACQKGMVQVGEKFRKEEFFLPELLISAELFGEITRVLQPKLIDQDKQAEGRMVLGTVKGDLHDIGKNIFKMVAEANGFTVYDLGIDVPPEAFVETIKEKKAQIVGMSGLLTTAFDSMEKTVQQIQDAGLRDGVKIIIGGAPVDENIRRMVGADAHTRNASEGVELCKKLINGM